VHTRVLNAQFLHVDDVDVCLEAHSELDREDTNRRKLNDSVGFIKSSRGEEYARQSTRATVSLERATVGQTTDVSRLLRMQIHRLLELDAITPRELVTVSYPV
jgi:hypothetical protein